MPSTQLLFVISLIWQHVLTSEGHLQANGIKYVKANAHNFNYAQKLDLSFTTVYTLLCILYDRPEDDTLRLKHVATLKI
jgi:hypothetical protein